jgi:hypothetical protein
MLACIPILTKMAKIPSSMVRKEKKPINMMFLVATPIALKIMDTTPKQAYTSA